MHAFLFPAALIPINLKEQRDGNTAGQMSLFHLILIAIIQGITEFLPISSSGHLILLPNLTGPSGSGSGHRCGGACRHAWARWFFISGQDVKQAMVGLPRALTGRADTPAITSCAGPDHRDHSNRNCRVDPASHRFGSTLMRSIAVIGWTMLGFGLVAVLG